MDPILPGVRFDASNNHGGKFGIGLPDTLVVHYTAGTSLAGAVQTLKSPSSEASAHFVVDRDGTVVQLVPLDTIAWHAGASRHLLRTGLNKFSIGIEIVNAGRLKRSANGDLLTWFGEKIAPEQAIELTHRNESAPAWWDLYPEVQIKSVFDLARKLIDGLSLRFLLGHEEIAPGRKSDPGPAFPLDQMRSHLLGSKRNVDEDTEALTEPVTGIVIANLLNTRVAPSVISPKASVPLRRGTAITVVNAQPGWLEIAAPVHAWLKREHVELNATPQSAAMHGPGVGFESMRVDSGSVDSDDNPRPDSGGSGRPSSGGSSRPDSGTGERPDSSFERQLGT